MVAGYSSAQSSTTITSLNSGSVYAFQYEVIDTLPTADFTTDTDLTVAKDRVTTLFDSTDDLGADIVSWSWDLDGNIGTIESTDENPEFTFTATGNVDVTLTVTDSRGNTDSVTKTISVEQGVPTINEMIKLYASDAPRVIPLALVSQLTAIEQSSAPKRMTTTDRHRAVFTSSSLMGRTGTKSRN